MVIWALVNSLGGEVFYQKYPAIESLTSQAIGPNCKKPIIGIRPGEKIHEEMITSSDSFTTIDLGEYYAILPSDGGTRKRYEDASKEFKRVRNGYAYNSGDNPHFLTIEEIRSLIVDHVDKNFEPV